MFRSSPRNVLPPAPVFEPLTATIGQPSESLPVRVNEACHETTCRQALHSQGEQETGASTITTLKTRSRGAHPS